MFSQDVLQVPSRLRLSALYFRYLSNFGILFLWDTLHFQSQYDTDFERQTRLYTSLYVYMAKSQGDVYEILTHPRF